MKKKVIKTITQTAVMAALTFICTVIITFSYGADGFFNLGDTMILFSTVYFGPIVGICSGIIGTVFGDLALGYAAFAPFTLLAKGLEAILCFFIYYFLRKTKYVRYVSVFIAPLIMVATYFLAYNILFDMATALHNSPFDLVQGALSSALGFYLINVFERTHFEHFDWSTFTLFKKKEALLVK